MKYTFFAVVCSLMLAGAVSAQPQQIELNGEHNVAPAPQGEALSFEEILTARETETQGFHSYWHCTAYAEGHGHDLGYDYTDVHYEHAYHGAIQTCESATHHHCHDVHCHQDHD